MLSLPTFMWDMPPKCCLSQSVNHSEAKSYTLFCQNIFPNMLEIDRNCSHRNINVANSFENTKWQHSYVTLFWYEWCKKILLQCVLNMDYFIHFYVMFCFTKICILAIKFFFKKLIVNLNLSKSKRCLRKVEGVNIVVLRISWILLKLL